VIAMGHEADPIVEQPTSLTSLAPLGKRISSPSEAQRRGGRGGGDFKKAIC
jgi:hypothetical protein